MSVGTSAVSIGPSVIGAYSQAQSQRSALQYQASVARANAAMVESQASDAIRTGQTAEGVQDLRTAQLFSTQRTSMAAGGVDLGTGSPSDVLATTKFMGARDALQIHDNALMQAWGYRTQAADIGLQAQAAQTAASNINPWMAAGTSLLTSASSLGRAWDTQAKLSGGPDFSTTLRSKASSAWINFWNSPMGSGS